MMKPDNALTISYFNKHPADAARVLESLPYAMTANLLEQLSPDQYITAFQYLLPSYAANTLDMLQVECRNSLLSALPVEKLSMLLTFVDDEKRSSLLAQLSPDKKKNVIRRMQYPRDTVGTVMSPPAFSLPDDISVAEALKRIKNSRRNYSSEVFVIDRSLKYSGTVTIDKLVKSTSTKKLGTIADSSIKALSTRKTLHNLSEDPAWSSVRMLPVVDSKGAFSGVLEYSVLLQHIKIGITPAIIQQSAATPLLELIFQTLALLAEIVVIQLSPFEKTKIQKAENNDSIT